jgi:hypothetical protein
MPTREAMIHTARLRARFLAAMSLPVALIACSAAQRPDGPNDADGTRSDRPKRAWSVATVEKPTSQTDEELPTCPGGSFCVVGAREGAVGHARPPFAACAQTVPYPSELAPADATSGGPHEMYENYEIDFNANQTAHERKAKDAGACCYEWFEPCPGGRPLRDPDGAPILATLDARAGWSRATASHVRDLERARHWARAAQYEHASVASFAQFSLQLLALGAPPDLIERSHRAALDEIRHAELAFTLAKAYGHGGIGPGPLPLATSDLAVTPEAVLRATLRDGCVAETRAALQARRDLAEARSDLERDALAQIADDEERHAELAFATVAWLVATFGTEVRTALADELDRLPADALCEEIVRPCLRALASAADP